MSGARRRNLRLETGGVAVVVLSGPTTVDGTSGAVVAAPPTTPPPVSAEKNLAELEEKPRWAARDATTRERIGRGQESSCPSGPSDSGMMIGVCSCADFCLLLAETVGSICGA